MVYVVHIHTDFGKLVVDFETEEMLDNTQDVIDTALLKIGDSNDIALKDAMLVNYLLADIVEGVTTED